MYSEQQIDIVLSGILYVRMGEYNDICPEIDLLYTDYHKIYKRVVNKVKEELKLLSLDEDNQVENYIKDRFVNHKGVKFDMNVIKTNFYYEKALELYVKLCRVAYKNMEKLVKENDILESE